jgi:putative sterol carrier protein/multimeric flavodoxin WrbA
MNINIYYGGRGLIEDPTLNVIEKIENVLEELRVKVTRYNLFEYKNTIPTLPQTIKEADGIILAVNVEWMGIGGLMTQFLDACWLYGDKAKISTTYMEPVVIATTYGEKQALVTLKEAWELLGGITLNGISTYVEDTVEFEMNKEYTLIIEKETENLYKSVSKKVKRLPSSSYVIKQRLIKESLNLTPQESEQLSKYVTDDIYVKKQKEDIEELTNMFKGMLSEQSGTQETEFISDFQNKFKSPIGNFTAAYLFMFEDNSKSLLIEVNNKELNCKYEKKEDVDVLIKLNSEVMTNITRGRMTFQRAFMTGDIKAKGNFKTLRMLDEMFNFSE